MSLSSLNVAFKSGGTGETLAMCVPVLSVNPLLASQTLKTESLSTFVSELMKIL